MVACLSPGKGMSDRGCPAGHERLAWRRADARLSGRPVYDDLEHAVGVGLQGVVVAVAASDDLGEKNTDPCAYLVCGLFHAENRRLDIAVVDHTALLTARLEWQSPTGQGFQGRTKALSKAGGVFGFKGVLECFRRHRLYFPRSVPG